MKLMISQPMRGKTESQIREERKKLVEKLESQGHEIINTIFEQEAPGDSHAGIYFLAKSIEALSKVDGIVFMPGWENARGCQIEYEVAKKYNKFIRIEEE